MAVAIEHRGRRGLWQHQRRDELGFGMAEGAADHGYLKDRHRRRVYRSAKRRPEREEGKLGGAVGASVTENRTVENMERIFEAAKTRGYEVFISPHYFYPTDNGWKMNGPLEADEFKTHTFARSGPLTLSGFHSGADWLDRFKRYIEDGKTIVVSPHKVFGPQTNDLVLQLRKRGISKIILGRMLANMCVESHLRELLEQGFEVAMVKDATAGRRHPVWGNGYQAAVINYQFLAHAVLSTDETVDGMR